MTHPNPVSSDYALKLNHGDRHLAPPPGTFGLRKLPATRILTVPVSLIDMTVAVDTVVGWAEQGTSAMVCVRDVHGIMCAEEDPALQAVHERASMITPDGMPLALVSRMRGHQTARVPGPSLVEHVCRATQDKPIRHFLFGGKEGIADRMAENLRKRFPGVQIVGTFSPPFGTLSDEARGSHLQQILATEPDIVWIGMSTPRQDFWMDANREALAGKVLIGVGAAFDFHAGEVQRAPRWMQDSGLEWLHRLGSEPRRLWRRYLVMAPKFLFRVTAASLQKS
ncbi:WecB/TagA/CpsF family glycosyltransferase [Sphingosinithalassobacter sp. CS137]|uniref:WecB/TagA/CpsF family glycosyltransferase n=1 Tax=Sphingosinithalassobacter sp. CS137 TaxID=2762748 RepID=UPI001CB6CDCD|nr:WecB/TagA/CpsF family glycosyltransferase [Sphingosinithalassobacter sp. CS137]